MKRYIIYLLSIIVLISCSKEQDTITNNGVNYSPKFYAEIDNTLTRTYVNDALKVCWSENDRLSVFTSTENQLYQFDGNTGDSEGTFSKVESYSSSTGASLSVDANYAVYPHSKETTISSDGTLTFVLPQNQVYAQNSFGINSNPMIAVTENRNDTYLSFKNICGYLRVSLYGDSITAKSIRLEGNSNERISGKANVSISYGQEPIITLTDDALHTITLDCQDGVQIGESASDATEFWFVVPPVTFENGFTLIIEDINGNKYAKTTENRIEIKRSAINNMVVSKVDQLMEYYELTQGDNGIDAIITKDGLYASVKQIPESSDYMFVVGDINEESKPYLMIDEKGFLKAINLGNDNIAPVIYTSDHLLLLNSEGEVQYEIPYSEINVTPTTRTFTDYGNPVWNCVKLVVGIKNYITEPIEKGLEDLRRRCLEGALGRYGSELSDVLEKIEHSFEKDIIGWAELFIRAQENSYFGNVNIQTLNAIKKGVCTFSLPAQIDNLRLFTLNNQFQKLLTCKYTLVMETENDSNSESENQKQEKEISSDGIENFDFTFINLNELYNYRASLVLEFSYETLIDIEYYDRVTRLTPYAAEWTPNPQVHSMKWAVVGNVNSLATGSVSSSVENVENEKSTSADVICSFSDIPSGAECQILITKEGTDISQIFSGQPDCKNQRVSVSGLTPSTTYIASSRITYKGIPYYGLKTVSFSTPGPSGYLISIPEEQITATSAVVKCQFSNVESGVECGIIVKGEDGSSKTISASNVESEQEVTISGLQPATQYTCTSYVKLTHSQGSYYKEGNSLSFTTDLPDVTGTWTCKEKHGENYETYTVTLHKDGTVTTTSSSLENYKYKSWSQSAKGLSVRFIWFSGDMGHDLSITFDNPTNPTKGTGQAHVWTVSSWGISHDTWYGLEMTR